MINDFIFDGQRLSDFGYMIANIDSNSGTETNEVSNMSYTDVKAPLSNISYNVSTSYENNLNRKIQIIKNTCENDNLKINNYELSDLTRWLCRKDYKKFKWIDEDSEDDDEIFYNVKINLSKIEINHKIGFELDITTDRPYGYTRLIKNNMDFTKSTSNSITVYTDDEGIIYPDITITIKEDGDLKLTNDKDSHYTFISDCKSGEVITIYGGDTLQIVSSREDRSFSDTFNYRYPRLCTKYRDYRNTFTGSLKCIINMQYVGIRKVGL